MKVITLSLLMLASCAPPQDQTCTVAHMDTGAVINCPDGTSATISNGATGPAGATGDSCSVVQTNLGATITCGSNTVYLANGDKGNPGAAGSSCSTTTLAVGSVAAPNGGLIVSCTNGSAAVVVNGTNGTNGTVITPIQFCTNFTQSYPNTFAESGICINNTMYGVYSANGGFLAELPPGTYSSDGINASCTFTIGQNCTVTQ